MTPRPGVYKAPPIAPEKQIEGHVSTMTKCVVCETVFCTTCYSECPRCHKEPI